ncbi:MAG: hypothetical protein DMG13_00840 [Acidobacteria bacterium]|nr:MAG: hypothetical protein DMG13_00840 [Acidobacteriota bacterium]
MSRSRIAGCPRSASAIARSLKRIDRRYSSARAAKVSTVSSRYTIGGTLVPETIDRRTDVQGRIAFLASAVEQANHAIRKKMDELSLARRVGDAISHHTSISSLSAELMNAIAETMNCNYALVYSGSDASPFELQAVSGVFPGSEEFPGDIRNTEIARHLVEHCSPIHIENVADDRAWSEDWPFPNTVASWLCMPLLARTQLRGVLCLANQAPGPFDERTLRMLMIVGPQLASAFANITLYDHLRESEAKYRTLVARIQDVVYICDQQWQILDANPAAEARFGASIAGRMLTELFASPDTANQFLKTMRVSGIVQNFETELLTTGGERIVTLLSCVRDGDRYSGIIKDVTERTRLIDQITRAQKMDSIGTLASGVAHDFNNILGIILPNAELIQLRTDPSLPAVKFAGVIINASKRAAQLTRQLLSLSRQDPVMLRTISLSEAVRTTGKLLSATVDRNIRMEFDLSSGPTDIKADETQVEQVLLNLAINARDAMPDGGLIRFTTCSEEGTVMVRVTDTGTGMDRDTLPKIFDPFFTTKHKSRGTGLGLSVVYGIVKQLGGSVDVRSEVGVGTEFIIRFPQSSEPRKAPPVQDSKPVGGSETILVVDDEPEMVNLLQTALTGLGYHIVAARNGREAVERAADDIDLIILDMIMPEMDGSTALRGIREKTPGVKVLISTGYTSPEKIPLVERIGVEGFVQKPFELGKLAATVRDVLDGIVV